jgi:hypothetical protein
MPIFYDGLIFWGEDGNGGRGNGIPLLRYINEINNYG